MKEKSILLYPHEVRGVLEGRQTRITRLIKPQPDTTHGGEPYWNIGGYRLRDGALNPLVSPYQVGMRLWVRETWAYDEEGRTIYKASDPSPSIRATHWKPSIHMRRLDSRFTLEVTGVRVERVQDITEEDAKAEGVRWSNGDPDEHGLPTSLVVDARDEFQSLWSSIHPPSSWAANPFCWVYNIKRVEVEG